MLGPVIVSFADRQAERLWAREHVPTVDPRLWWPVLRKLAMLAAAANLNDLAVPPGNRLEALRGDRQGQHSIRVNDQWRLCFRWTAAGPADVELVDYH